MFRRNKKLISKRIAKLRNKRGWSTYQLSQQSGFAESTIRNWENGTVTPKEENRDRVFEELGVNIREELRKTPEQREIDSWRAKHYLDRMTDKTRTLDKQDGDLVQLSEDDEDLRELRTLWGIKIT